MTAERDDVGQTGDTRLAAGPSTPDGPDDRHAGEASSHRLLSRLRTSRRSPGRRARRRRARRRRMVLRGVLAVVATALAGWVALGVAASLSGDGAEPGEAPVARPSDPGQAPADTQPAIVLATFDETDPGRGATHIVVLSATGEEGTILLVPAATLADVPGHGLLQLGRSYGFGQAALLDASLDNLLGVDFDQVLGVSRQDWAALFTRVGGLTMDVPGRLVDRREDGSSQVRFEPGEQFLDGPRLAEYMTFREAGESELESLSRIHRVLTALLDRIAAEPDVLDAIFDDGAPMLEAPDPGPLRDLLARLSSLHETGEVATLTLPVSPIGSGDRGSYRVDRERVDRLIATRFDASITDGGDTANRSLQVLNGQGTPGIGQEVAQLLIPAGYQVVLTGNADSFDHARTKILVYSEDPGDLAAARRIRELLGVGVVERSEAPQSVVDVTIVVGADFPPDDG